MIHWHYIAWLIAAVLIALSLLGFFGAGMASRAVTSEDTRFPRIVGIIGLALLALTLVACGQRVPIEGPEPVIKTVEVKVATPVACAALGKLGSEPAYADTDAALATAPDIFEQTKLLLQGRLQRTKRLLEYGAARTACLF